MDTKDIRGFIRSFELRSINKAAGDLFISPQGLGKAINRLEAELGVGYARLWYKESDCIPCMKSYERKHKNYFGPTKAALSLVYFF